MDKASIKCPSCGAEFDKNSVKCPYCGWLNYDAAEKAHMDKLEDIKDELEGLNKVPYQEIKKELKNRWHFVIKVMLAAVIIICILVILESIARRHVQYDGEDEVQKKKWFEEYAPVLDEYYKEMRYEDMCREYRDFIQKEEYVPYLWKHNEFMRLSTRFYDALAFLEEESSNGRLKQYEYAELLMNEWIAYDDGYYDKKQLSDKEKSWIKEYTQPLLSDFNSRWGFSDSEIAEFESDKEIVLYGIPYDMAEKIVEEWK